MNKDKKKSSRPDRVVGEEASAKYGLSSVACGKQEPEKQPAANKLSKQRIEKLFRMFCFNRSCAIDSVDLKRLKWKDCSGCILREIPWERKKGQVEDLCYSIWYEGVLND